MLVGHTPFGYDAGAARTYGQTFQGTKVYGALYFPWVRVADPIGDTPKWIPPTGHIMGVYARTERKRGIWKAPAGNAAKLNNVLDIQHHITDAVHTNLVKSGSVNAVRFLPGLGHVIDSSRTLSTNPIWFYVNIRLLFNFVKSSLTGGLRWVVQEPNDETLWNKAKFNSITPFLMGLWRRGAFGAGSPEEVFTIKIDAENNPPDQIQQGYLNIEVYFYPVRPAETIIITIGQQESGATSSES
jgi:phage tail sheath protein FI